jgi:YegS/Rv2252/BmrU family lipid kinase
MFDNLPLGIILNPTAGKHHASHIENKLIYYLRAKKISYRLEKTKYPSHATDIAKRLSKEHEIIVAAGGDGTINEVASGIYGSKSALAILPIGSGNDFNKMIKVPRKIDQAIDSIVNGKKKVFKFGKICVWDSFGKKKSRYFINTVGIGLDAEIANKIKNIKLLRGLPLYLVAAIKALKIHSPNEYTIRDGSLKRTESAFFICVGNGCFEGGGFQILPHSNPNNPYMHICMIGSMPMWKALRLIPSLVKGTHSDKQQVSMWKSKHFIIDAKKPFVLHCDGEIINEGVLKVEIKLASKGICVIVPSNNAFVL